MNKEELKGKKVSYLYNKNSPCIVKDVRAIKCKTVNGDGKILVYLDKWPFVVSHDLLAYETGDPLKNIIDEKI